jgi:hypothetical protein
MPIRIHRVYHELVGNPAWACDDIRWDVVDSGVGLVPSVLLGLPVGTRPLSIS